MSKAARQAAEQGVAQILARAFEQPLDGFHMLIADEIITFLEGQSLGLEIQ
jgi:hypothetical protein